MRFSWLCKKIHREPSLGLTAILEKTMYTCIHDAHPDKIIYIMLGIDIIIIWWIIIYYYYNSAEVYSRV